MIHYFVFNIYQSVKLTCLQIWQEPAFFFLGHFFVCSTTLFILKSKILIKKQKRLTLVRFERTCKGILQITARHFFINFWSTKRWTYLEHVGFIQLASLHLTACTRLEIQDSMDSLRFAWAFAPDSSKNSGKLWNSRIKWSIVN